MKKNVIYILSSGRVAAINNSNGEIIWEIKLRSYVKSSMVSGIGQISVEGDKLLIGVGGMLFCLKTKDGSLVWVNELKGWGFGFVSIAGAGQESAAAMNAAQAANAATIAAASTANAS